MNKKPTQLDLDDNSLSVFKVEQQAILFNKSLVENYIYLNYINPEAVKDDFKSRLIHESQIWAYEVPYPDDQQLIKFELKSSSGSIRQEKGSIAASDLLLFLKERLEEQERKKQEMEDSITPSDD